MVLALAGVAAAVAPLSFLASIYSVPMLVPPEVSRCISSCLTRPRTIKGYSIPARARVRAIRQTQSLPCLYLALSSALSISEIEPVAINFLVRGRGLTMFVLLFSGPQAPLARACNFLIGARGTQFLSQRFLKQCWCYRSRSST